MIGIDNGPIRYRDPKPEYDEYEDRTEEPAEIDDCYDDYPSREELYEAALEAENWWGRY